MSCPEVMASWQVSVCLLRLQGVLGSQGCPARQRRRQDCQGGCMPVSQPFPRGWLPGSRELICYLLGRLPEPSSPPVFAQGWALQKLKPAGHQAQPALMGSCLGLPSMGRIRGLGGAESGAWAGPADVAGLAPFGLLPRSYPHPRRHHHPGPGPRPRRSTWADEPGWLEFWPCPSPPLRHGVNH